MTRALHRPRTALLAATAAVAVAAPIAAATAPTAPALPALQATRTLTASAAAPLDCARGPLSGASVARTRWTAPATGFLDVRSADRAGDWDLALLSGRRVVASSAGFGSAEVVQTWLTVGQTVTVQACRRSGATATLPVALRLLTAPLPEALGTPSLVEVAYRGDADLATIESLGLDLTHQHGNGKADVIAADAGQLRLLREAGLDYEVEIADLGEHYAASRRADAAYATEVGVSALPSGRTGYRQYADYQAELKKLAADNPSLVKPVVLPKKSLQGRELQGVEIAGDVNGTDGRPVFFLMGVHHAREWPSGEIAMEYATMLTQGYGTDERVTALLDSIRVVVVPLINPDGFVASRGAVVSPGDTTGNGNVQTVEAIAPPGGTLAYRRKNCAGEVRDPAIPCELQYGVDPNRNYGEGWGGNGAGTDRNVQSYRGPGPWSETETQAVHEYSQRRQVTGLVTLHTVGALVLRPPGRSFAGKAPDENRLKEIGDAMGDATGYPSQFSFQLYDTSGTTEDWNYAAAGTYGYTIEIGPSGGQFHMPYATGVVQQWEGTGSRKGKGLREALLLAAEAAAEEADHAVLTGTATPGHVLRVRKTFVTKTGPQCTYAQGYVNSTGVPPAASAINCVAPGPVVDIPDFLDTTTVVPAGGAFSWHVGPSTRPFVGARYDNGAGEAVPTGQTEAWTLTCETPSGQVLRTQSLVTARGDRLALGPLC